jgi:two-component system, chemotaxis family, chemotaxis protein CheY
MEPEMKHLMIVEEYEVVRKVAKRILSGMGYHVSEAGSTLEALVRCESELPDVLIVDSAMDGALELIGNIRRLPDGKQSRIYYSVIEADLKRMMQGKRAGADDFLLKPFDRKILTSVFANLSVAA